MKKYLVMALVFCLLFGSTIICNADGETFRAGVAFGTNPAGAMFIDGDPANGFAGVEIEFLDAVLQCCGVEMEYQDVTWDALFTGLLSGKWDVAACHIFVTKDRMEQMAFADPYLSQDICLMVRTDAPVNTLEEMKGKTICADSGAGGEKWLREHMDEYGPYTIQTYSGTTGMWPDVLSGRCDAAIGDSIEIEYYVLDYPELTTGAYMNMGYNCAYAFRQGEPILDKFNQCQRELKQNGFLEDLYVKYMGVKPQPDSASYKLYEDAPYIPEN